MNQACFWSLSLREQIVTHVLSAEELRVAEAQKMCLVSFFYQKSKYLESQIERATYPNHTFWLGAKVILLEVMVSS